MLVRADSVAPQAWRNGGGQTRELLAWPAGGDWKLRISRADIDADGPFSAFPQVQRWFTVLRGAGVVLKFADFERTLKIGDAPLHFDGAAAVAPGLWGDRWRMDKSGAHMATCVLRTAVFRPWGGPAVLMA